MGRGATGPHAKGARAVVHVRGFEVFVESLGGGEAEMAGCARVAIDLPFADAGRRGGDGRFWLWGGRGLQRKIWRLAVVFGDRKSVV